MAVVQPRTAQYRVTIDWGAGTAVDTAAYNDVSPYYLNQPGLSVDGIGRDQVRAYAPPAAPAFDLTLNNWSGRFSPGGPIGGFVSRGSPTFLDATWGADQGCNSAEVAANDPVVLANGVEPLRLFDGILTTVDHTLTRPSRSTQLRALGHIASLLDKKPTSTQLYENIRTDQAITHLLDAVGWPADKRVIDTGDTSLLYWWMDGQTTALDMLNALLGAEGAGGCAYEQAGVFHFEGRQSRQLNPRSLETQWLLTDGLAVDPGANSGTVLANDSQVLANGSTTIQLYDVNPSEYTSNPDEVVASAQAQVNQRVPVPAQTGGAPPEVGTIWEYGAPLAVPAGRTVVTEGLLADPYRDAVVPVRQPAVPDPGTAYDYVTEPIDAPLTVTLLASSGLRVQIEWTAGATPLTINGVSSNGPQLRAVSLPVASTVTVRSTVDTSAMAERYAGRQMDWQLWPEVSVGEAQAVVNSMCLRYMQERRQATIRLANLDARHLQAMLHIRIADRVVWVQRHGGLNDPYWVEQIGHEIAPGGGLHIVTLGLERVFDLVGERFDHPYAPGSRGFDYGRFGE